MTTPTLTRYVWDDRIKVGLPLIDSQHRELIEAINDLADAIESHQGAVAVKKLIAFLKGYAEWHFGQEESCAFRHQCPLAETNQKAHARFLAMLNEWHREYTESGGSEEQARRIHAALGDWLVDHIYKIDTMLAQEIRQAQSSQS
ncbi:MAG: hemerythrin family protein [Gloeomargarita sp. SKYG116]|nr:hemerythrin family protein [Gloeomargarita sp. SKYG116]MDW8401074.1 hemerythrin family protein [Gloeomargarita sp. SKYGB_i_bin116]